MPVAAPETDAPSTRTSLSRQAPRHVALFVDGSQGGSAPRSMLTLAGELRLRGHKVDLISCGPAIDVVHRLPEGVRPYQLGPASGLRTRLAALRADPGAFVPMVRPLLLPWRTSEWPQSLTSLAQYLRRDAPDVLLTATPFLNLTAIWARRLAGVPTRVIVGEHTSVRATLLSAPRWERRFLLPLMSRTYAQADAVVSVSKALADEFAEVADFPRDRITTIYDPVVGPEIARLRDEPVDHPWLARGQPPVVLCLGGLAAQKDFPTLIRAFAKLRSQRPARLIILSDDEREDRRLRADIERTIGEDGVGDAVDLPGFVLNPFAWLAKANLFVLSSLFEGLPGALIEAMACGCPVVSTDCPTGPREILQSGRFGPLVPVGDPEAMAEAMGIVLDSPPPARILEARAADFSVKASIDRYEALMFDALPELAALRPAA